MDAVAAVDALGFVDPADARLVVGDGPHGASLLAGPLLVDDGPVGTSLGTQAAGLALIGIDAHFGISGGNGAELTGVQTGFA